jgi:hypothetical protein
VALTLLVIGGVLYTIGAIVLARRPSDPHPTVFGSHGVWRTFVVGANACHYALVTPFVQASRGRTRTPNVRLRAHTQEAESPRPVGRSALFPVCQGLSDKRRRNRRCR